jgi:hypothetical protein
MKHLKVFSVALGILFSVSVDASAQGSLPLDPHNPPPEYVRRVDERRREWDRMNGRDDRGMIAGRSAELKRPLPPRTRPDGKPYTEEELEQIEAMKKPSAADAKAFADFLRQPGTGMFRLFPYLQCREKGSIRVDAECAGYIPESWSYSFRDKKKPYLNYFDIKYRGAELVTGSLLSLGVMTALGDVPLDKVSLTSGGVKFLSEIKPETAIGESGKQIESIRKGVESGNYKYSGKVGIEENMTYGLRVTAYRMPDSVSLYVQSDDLGRSGLTPINKFDERDDVIVVFRIIRKDSNGVITIVWKRLSRTDAPELVFPENLKFIDVKERTF